MIEPDPATTPKQVESKEEWVIRIELVIEGSDDEASAAYQQLSALSQKTKGMKNLNSSYMRYHR